MDQNQIELKRLTVSHLGETYAFTQEEKETMLGCVQSACNIIETGDTRYSMKDLYEGISRGTLLASEMAKVRERSEYSPEEMKLMEKLQDLVIKLSDGEVL